MKGYRSGVRREPTLRHQRTLQVLADITARTRATATALHDDGAEHVRLVPVDHAGIAPLVRLVVDEEPVAPLPPPEWAVPTHATLAAAATVVVGGLGIVAAIVR